MRTFLVFYACFSLLLSLCAGCFLPLHFPVVRQEPSLAIVARDKVFFVDASAPSATISRVDVFDTISNEWTNFNLSKPRRFVYGAADDSRVVFSGDTGENEDYSLVDIYDLDLGAITASKLRPERGLFPRMLVANNKVIMASTEQQGVMILDLATMEFSRVTSNSGYNFGTTNGTHAFLTNSGSTIVDVLDLETMEWSNFTKSPFPLSTLIYSNGYVYLIGGTMAEIHSTSSAEIITYNYQRNNAYGRTAVVINQNIILIGSGYTIINPWLNYEIQHQFSFIDAYNSVYSNGIIFAITARQNYVIDSRYFPQPLPITTATSVSFIERDVMFFFGEPNIMTYPFHTGRVTVHPFIRDNNLRQRIFVQNRLLMIASNFRFPAFIYNFEDDSMEQFTFPNTIDSPWLHNGPVGVGNFAVLRTPVLPNYLRDTSIYLFNVITRNVTLFPLPNAIAIAAYKEHLAVLTNDKVILCDVENTRIILEILIPGQLTNLFVAGDMIFVVFRSDDRTADSIQVMDPRRNFLTIRRLAAPMNSPRMIETRDYVVFTSYDLGQTQVVEWFDLRNFTWNVVTLPQTLPSGTLILRSIGNTAFIGRLLTIDAVDLSTGSITTQALPLSTLFNMFTLGSKLIYVAQMVPVLAHTTFIYETTTTEWTSILVLPGSTQVLSDNLLVNIETANGVELLIMPIASVHESFEDKELFIGQSTNLTLNAAGPQLRYKWTHDDKVLYNDRSNLLLKNVTMASTGNYRVDIYDHCNFHMKHQARLIVHDKPSFEIALEDSVTLCNDVAELTVSAEGKSTEFMWKIDGTAVYSSDGAVLNISTNDIPCNTHAMVCVIAFNPSGQSESCAGVSMLDREAVIFGPLPTIASSTWFAESVVDLHVQILNDDCTNHTWFIDGVRGASFETQSSTMSVELSASMERTQFYVRVKCGNTGIQSRTFIFEKVSALPIYGLVLIIIGVVIGIAVFIFMVTFFRGRLKKSYGKEIELAALLSTAKTDSLKKESTPIINTTTWQWTPTDDFSYKSIDSLPITIDASQLTFSEKSQPIEVDMKYSKELTFSSRSQKKKRFGLGEQLLSEMKIDIYAPKSPKYEVIVEPETILLEYGASCSVTVSAKMQMTSKCKVVLIVVLEQQKIYSAIEFKLESKMSPWIDLEEVQMNGEFLGSGAFGSVIRGVYRGQEVAVKKLLIQFLEDEVKKEFDREVSLMKNLRHPNIVQFVGASNVTESLAIVIEYAPLGSLASVIQKHQLSTQFKITCFLEIAKALQFLHLNGVIHRDIKPQNILVFSLENKAQVHVKLTDFGTSRFISDDTTTITKNVGTISFMAPEALGRNPRIDKSADIYSLAVLMWSVLFEQNPFVDFKWDSEIEIHVKSGSRLPFPHGHEMDPVLIKLIEDCWHQDPSHRPSINIIVQRLSNIRS